MVSKSLSVLIVLLLSCSHVLRADPVTIEQASSLAYYTEEYAPANFYSRGKLVGASVETLQLIWRHMEVPEQKIIVVPWARGYRLVERQENSVLFTMARMPEREDKFKWVGPIYDSKHVLVAKSKRNFNLKKFEDAYDYRVAIVRGDISEVSLRSLDFPNRKLARAADLKQAFLMLRSDRVDMIVMTHYGLKYAIEQFHEPESKYQVVWHINTLGNYYAFNRDTPDQLIEAFQKAFNQVEAQRAEIKAKYNLNDVEE